MFKGRRSTYVNVYFNMAHMTTDPAAAGSGWFLPAWCCLFGLVWMQWEKSDVDQTGLVPELSGLRFWVHRVQTNHRKRSIWVLIHHLLDHFNECWTRIVSARCKMNVKWATWNKVVVGCHQNQLWYTTWRQSCILRTPVLVIIWFLLCQTFICTILQEPLTCCADKNKHEDKQRFVL